MSVNTNRAKLNTATTSKHRNALLTAILYPDYWDEGIIFKYGKLYPYQWRQFRTWKHNRKTQYKQHEKD